MNLLNTHIYRLCFNIDDHMSDTEINKKWNKFKRICESGENYNKYILEQIKENCKLESNKNLPILKREEGGLGGNNNSINKQIRFRHIFNDIEINGEGIPYFKKDNNIFLTNITSTNQEKWTYAELDDIIYGFIKTANFYMGFNCVSGYIEIRNKIMMTDNYLNDDDDND